MFTQFIKLLFFGLVIVGFSACEPSLSLEADELGPAPGNVTFDIIETDDPNIFILQNTTAETFLHSWELGNNEPNLEGDRVEATFPKKGEFVIKLTAFNRGGSNSSSKGISIAEDIPIPPVSCDDEIVKLLTNDCTSRTWGLNPVEGALLVGPVDGSEVWWALPEGELEDRFCMFDDEWIFDSEGVMIYDAKGDVWAEDYMGFNFECVDEGLLSPQVAPWGSGTHNYTVTTTGGITSITMTGLGAFFGLPKVANGAEVTTPQSSVIYDISSTEDLADRYVIHLSVNVGGGIWELQMVHFK